MLEDVLEFLFRPVKIALGWILSAKIANTIVVVVISVLLIVLMYVVNSAKLQRYFG